MNEMAKSFLRWAAKDAIKAAEKTIEQCAALAHKDTKMNDAGKSYFAHQADENIEAVKELRSFLGDI